MLNFALKGRLRVTVSSFEETKAFYNQNELIKVNIVSLVNIYTLLTCISVEIYLWHASKAGSYKILNNTQRTGT
jgi:hypothetical protein